MPVITLTWPRCLLVDIVSNNMSAAVITKLPSGKPSEEPVPDIPQPTEGHGLTMKNDVLEPLWAEEEEELSLPQDVIDDLLNNVHDSDEEEEDGDCILQNGIDDKLDSNDLDEA